MRRLTALPVAAALVIVLFVAAGCHRHRRPGQADRTTIYTNDPTTADRLSGFYEIENRAWRWSKKRFQVRVHTPDFASTDGAAVVLHFTIPQSEIDALKSVTISGDVAGLALPPQTYTTAGPHQYRRDVPASAFQSEDTMLTFTLDKVQPATGSDIRQLGIIVESTGFERKASQS